MNSLLSSLASPDVAQGVVNLTWDIDTQGVTDEDLKLGLAGDVSLTSENVEVSDRIGSSRNVSRHRSDQSGITDRTVTDHHKGHRLSKHSWCLRRRPSPAKRP